jgi:hypothetical protein
VVQFNIYKQLSALTSYFEADVSAIGRRGQIGHEWSVMSFYSDPKKILILNIIYLIPGFA